MGSVASDCGSTIDVDALTANSSEAFLACTYDVYTQLTCGFSDALSGWSNNNVEFSYKTDVNYDWFSLSYVLAVVFLCLDAVVLLVVLFRAGIPMRHDTISSYMGSGADGARLLIVMVAMTTWAVMAVHFQLWQQRTPCKIGCSYSITDIPGLPGARLGAHDCQDDNTMWANVLTVVSSLILVLTLTVPGGKYYEAAVCEFVQTYSCEADPLACNGR